jgi:transcription elongation factor Elf1
MVNLKEYLVEGLADWSDDKLDKKISKQTTKAGIQQEIFDWIKSNTLYRINKNKFKFDFSTLPITVNYDGDIRYISTTASLTNDIFQWGKVGGYFDCSYCDSLKSLEGAPKEVGGRFECENCKSLTSLEGAPNKVGGHFNCVHCTSLKTLEGAPKEVGGIFRCGKCGMQFTVNDVKKVSNVKEGIFC